MAEQTTQTIVVNVKTDDFDVYIGRGAPRLGLKGSPWGNPFPITPTRSREMAIAEYREWVLGSTDAAAVYIRAHVHELRGKRLGCWCAPLLCHGLVLAGMAGGE